MKDKDTPASISARIKELMGKQFRGESNHHNEILALADRYYDLITPPLIRKIREKYRSKG